MTAPFAETSYGVVKRLDQVRAWTAHVASRLGRTHLSILDYGCGNGDQLTAPLATDGHKVTGVDMHEPSIAQARARHAGPNLTFEVASLGDLKTSGPVFDLVICSEVLEHVDEPGPFLRDLRAILAAGGALILTTPNGYGSFEWLSSVERGMRRIGLQSIARGLFWGGRTLARRLRGLPPTSRPLDGLTEKEVGFLNIDSGHVQFFTVSRLEALVTGAGFSIVERRARTFLCGPYVDVIFTLLPAPQRWYRWNNAAADRLPFAFAADWMYLLAAK